MKKWGEDILPFLGYSLTEGEREYPKKGECDLKNLDITEAEAKAILALAAKLGLALPVPSPEPLAPVFDPVPTVPSAPVEPEPVALPPVTSGLFQTTGVPASPKPKKAPLSPSEKADRKASKEAKREFNRRLNSSINGHLGAATKAVGLGDSGAAADHLTKAMELVPSHWGGVMDRVIQTARDLGFAKVDAA